MVVAAKLIVLWTGLSAFFGLPWGLFLFFTSMTSSYTSPVSLFQLEKPVSSTYSVSPQPDAAGNAFGGKMNHNDYDHWSDYLADLLSDGRGIDAAVWETAETFSGLDPKDVRDEAESTLEAWARVDAESRAERQAFRGADA